MESQGVWGEEKGGGGARGSQREWEKVNERESEKGFGKKWGKARNMAAGKRGQRGVLGTDIKGRRKG